MTDPAAQLAARLATLTPEQRATLVAKLAARSAGRTGDGRIPTRPAGAPVRASYLQERLWLVDQWDHQGAAAYNLPTAFRLRGNLDVDRLSGALSTIVARHEALRTVFTARDGVPYQVVNPARPVELCVEDRTGLPVDVRESTVLAEVAADAAVPFDLERGPLIRMRLFRLDRHDHVLAMPAAHLCTDGWSVSLMATELAELYRADVEGRDPVLPDLPVQYPDFSAWQRSTAGGGELERHLRYWQDTLVDAPVVDLPTDRPRPPQQSHRGATMTHLIPVELTDRLRELARESDVTLFMVLAAAMNLLMCRYTGQDDIVMGTASAGRDHPQLESLIGFFTNMVVLRTDLSGNPTFTELLARTKAVTVDAFDHQAAPYDQVVERVNPPRDPSRNPLFQVAMDLQPGGFGFTLPGLTAEIISLDQGTARFDIAINTFEEADGLLMSVEYATDLFDTARMERMLGHYEHVLAAVVADPQIRLSQVPLLSHAERQQVLVEWQGSVRDHRREPVHVQFLRQAEATPEATALVYQGTEMTYGELARRVGLLARYLRAHGTGPGDVVGIGLERDPDSIVAILGVLVCGAAFVPLDLQDPSARAAFTLTDSGAGSVLSRSDLAGMLPAGVDQDVVLIDRIWAEAEALADQPCPDLSTPASPAYVLYTSGTTGRPKGAVVAQHAIAAYIDFLRTVFGFGPGSRVLQYTALIFDLSEGEIFAALTSGAALVLVPRATTLSSEDMSALLREQRVTYLGGPPAMVELLDAGPYPDLAGMLVGGEGFSGDLVNRWNTGDRLFLNAYGPTEATVGCTYYPCEHRMWAGSPPIGRAMVNRRVYLVDRWFNPVPVGVPGEILAAGTGLADGYLNRPALTAEKFVPDPFGPGRAYRTGDLGYWTEDGQIQFVGRMDTQVQLRGMRIELSEIEAVLGTHPAVERCVVALREDTPGDPRLVAYVIGPQSTDGLREHVAEHLPTYMVPSAFVPVESFPLSGTGKVDRRRLPAPDLTRRSAGYLPPRTEAERQVAEAFGEVLALPRVGATDNFFDLGGNSLQAARVVARIRAELGVGLAVRDFFTSPVVADLAAAVDQGRAAAPVSAPAVVEGPEVEGEDEAALREEIAALERRLREARQRRERSSQTGSPAGQTGRPGDAHGGPDAQGGQGGGLVAPASPPRLVRRGTDAGPAPLSYQQEQLWFMDRLVPGLAAYNVPLSLRLTGRLDVDQVRAALATVVNRHDTLRTTITVRDGAPVQVVAPAGPVDLPVTDVPAGTDVAVLADAETARAFDLERGPLLRARLFRVGPQDHLLTLTAHHIVSDGWSTPTLLGEFAEALAASIQGRAPRLPDLPVQYADFAAWQRERLSGAVLDEHLDFWASRLAGAPALELPADRPRPPVPSYRGEVVHRDLPARLLTGLREVSRARRASLFMTLLAAFDMLAVRYTGQTDVVVGTPVAGRDRAELEPLIGLFTNMMVLRTDVSDNPTFEQVLDRVREVTLDAYDHQDVPFDQVVARLAPRRDPGRNPLFGVMFGLLPGRVGDAEVTLPGLGARIGTPAQGTARFDLTINVTESEQALSVDAEYASDLFDADRIERLLGHLERVLAAVVANPSVRVGQLELVGRSESERLLSWGTGPRQAVSDTMLPGLVAAQAARTPERVAVLDAAGARLTYTDLVRRSGQIAALLADRGIGHGARVAVCLDRCAELVPTLLGVLESGAAYVPVDPWYPPERIRFMLTDSKASAVLTHTSLAGVLAGVTGTAQTLCLDTDLPDPPDHTESTAPPADRAAPRGTDPAYVIYTSGSTGVPKGVVVRHRALVNVLTDLTRTPGLRADDVVAAVTTPSFDIATVELFAPLLVGARVAVVPREETADGPALARRLAAFGATFGQGTPTTWRLLVDTGWRPPRGFRVLSGGEAFPPELARTLLESGAVVWNGYGPSETTVYSTMYQVTVVDGPVPLGRPIANTDLRVLDGSGRLCPTGVTGELHIGGAGLADGYLDRPNLTAERFVPDPINPTTRLYRTGDLARWRSDGLLEYLGRADTQIKLRGFRIEPGEIETVLAAHPGVGQVVVVAHGQTPGDQRLVAYLTATAGPLDPADLRDRLVTRLPSHLIPSDYVVLDALPTTPSGKVDRAALPEPDRVGHSATRHVPPRNATEQLVAQVYTRVLDAGQVGADDDFFLLGGNSLQAATALARIATATSVTVPMREFYSNPSVQAVAAAIRRATGPALADPHPGGPTGPVAPNGDQARRNDQTAHRPMPDPLVNLRPGGSRPPLFCVHNASGSAYTYLGLATRMDPDQPLLAFEAPGLDSDTPTPNRVEDLAEWYLTALRARQPHGPYRLLGHSMGGMVAFEMANRLLGAGQQVDLLALVDTIVPEAGDPPSTQQALRWFCEDLAGLTGRRPPRLDPTLGDLPEPTRMARLLDALRAAGLVPAEVDVTFLRRRLAVFTANATAMWTYQPSRPHPGTLTLIRARQSADTSAGWSALCDRLDDHVVSGDHFTVWAEPNLPRLAETVRDRLRGADASAPSSA